MGQSEPKLCCWHKRLGTRGGALDCGGWPSGRLTGPGKTGLGVICFCVFRDGGDQVGGLRERVGKSAGARTGRFCP